jgi:hypothetical protein
MMQGPLILHAPGQLALAQHLRNLLVARRRFASVELSAVPSLADDGAGMLARTAAAVTLPHPVLALGLPAALSMPEAMQVILVAEDAAALEEQMAALPGRDARLAATHLLRRARALVAFDSGAAEVLRQCGATVGSVVPAPTLDRGRRPAVASRAVLVLDHAPSAGLAAEAVPTLRRALPGVRILGSEAAPAAGVDAVLPALSAELDQLLLHLHLGTPPRERSPARVIDSFASRSAVVLHRPGPGLVGIEHEVNAMLCATEGELERTARALDQDEEFRAILTRNGLRRAHAHNHSVAERLGLAIPDVFG